MNSTPYEYLYKAVIEETVMANIYIFLGQKFSFNLAGGLQGGPVKPLKLYVNFAGMVGVQLSVEIVHTFH